MDLTKMPPMEQKRLVTFVNQFIIDTVSLLNQLIDTFETSLWELDKRMQKIDISIKLIETKLDSIPGIELQPRDAQMTVTKSAHTEEQVVPRIQGENTNTTNPNTTEDTTNTTTTTSTITITTTVKKEDKDDDISNNTNSEIPDDLQKYYKMIQVGVPIGAVKQKMISEGVDPERIPTIH